MEVVNVQMWSLFDTLLRITTDDSVQGCHQQFVQSILWYDIFKEISVPRICLQWYQGLNCTVTLWISWFSKGKDVTVLYKSAFFPLSFFSRKNDYIAVPEQYLFYIQWEMTSWGLLFIGAAQFLYRDCSYD